MSIYKLIVRDDTATCTLTWFNSFFLKNRFKIGETYKFFGKVKRKVNQIEMMTPIFDDEATNNNTGKIIPIYPSTFNLSQNTIRKVIENALLEAQNLSETLPKYLIDTYKLMGINEAIKQDMVSDPMIASAMNLFEDAELINPSK